MMPVTDNLSHDMCGENDIEETFSAVGWVGQRDQCVMWFWFVINCIIVCVIVRRCSIVCLMFIWLLFFSYVNIVDKSCNHSQDIVYLYALLLCCRERCSVLQICMPVSLYLSVSKWVSECVDFYSTFLLRTLNTLYTLTSREQVRFE